MGAGSSITYRLPAIPIVLCRLAFSVLVGCSPDTLTLQFRWSDLSETSAMPPAHGNTGAVPHNALTAAATETVVEFLLSLAEAEGVPNPLMICDNCTRAASRERERSGRRPASGPLSQ